jgi:SAM-dependent methyltransferase
MVVSVDYSYAVDANYASNGHRDNVLIVQGDIYALPVRRRAFEKVLCIGVLQHTPDPKRSFSVLPHYLQPGGHLVTDIYLRHPPLKQLFVTKYWVRPFTRRMDPETLYDWVERYVHSMWPLSRLIHRLPGGKKINWQLLVADYRGVIDLDERRLREWAVLDTFDMLAPAYDFPQTPENFRRWFVDAGLVEIDVHRGYNGVEGRGRMPR